MRALADTKTVVGLVEKVQIFGDNGETQVLAKIDTGATKSSIDGNLASELGLGKIIKTTFVKSASGSSVRPVVRIKLIIAGRELEEEFNIADRLKMKYPLLIGQNVIKKGFLVDLGKETSK